MIYESPRMVVWNIKENRPASNTEIWRLEEEDFLRISHSSFVKPGDIWIGLVSDDYELRPFEEE